MGLRDVTAVGGRANHRMYQSGVGVDTKTRFHAEVPLLALPCPTHLGVTFAVLVLGRTRRGDQRGVNDDATLHREALFRKYGIDLRKDGNGQLIGLEQTAESEDGTLIQDRTLDHVESVELPQERHVVQHFSIGRSE